MKKLKCLLKLYLILLLLALPLISCRSFRIAQHIGGESQALKDQEESPQFSEGIYVVQAGAFREIIHAKALRKKLEDKGYNAYILLTEPNKNEMVYKVYIGKFIKRAQAENLSEKIKKTDNLPVFVASKPPKGKYVVQAGAFSEIAYAIALRKKLEDKGYNAYIRLFLTNKSEKVYKVLIGEFLDTEQAESLSEEIQKKMDLQVFIILI